MHTFVPRAVRGLAFFAGVTFALAPAAHGQLPAAKDLIATWASSVNAQGWKGHKSARATAGFDMPAMGLSAKMETMQMFEPSMTKSKIEIPGMGEMWQGFDGAVMWSVNPMQGPQVITGAQADAAKEDSDPTNYSRLSAAIVSSETVEKTTLNGQECYKVRHTWKSGRTSHDCFAVSGGLIVWSQAKVVGPMGEAEVTTLFSDYKDYGGMKRASTTKVDQGGQQFIITLGSWEWDTVQASEMTLPAEIKAMVEKKP